MEEAEPSIQITREEQILEILFKKSYQTFVKIA